MSYPDATYDPESGIIKGPDHKYEFDSKGLGHAFFDNMKRHKSKLAQIHAETGQTENYDDLLLRCIRCATELRNSGIGPGDIVSICSRNTMDNIVPFYSAIMNGSIIASFDPTLSLEDMTFLIKQIEPRLIFVDVKSAEVFEGVIEQTQIDCEIVVMGESNKQRTLLGHFSDETIDENEYSPNVIDDLQTTAIILFSSGTTGLSKGICVTHEGLMYQAYNFLTTGYNLDYNLSYATTYWISTVILSTTNALFGKCRCVVESPFNPKELWLLIGRIKLTYMFLAPTQAVMLLKSGRPDDINTSSLRDVMIAGGPMSIENSLAIRDVLPGANVQLVYGQTEASGLASSFRVSDRKDVLLSFQKPASSGRPMPGFQYKVVDSETEEIVGLNQIGELYYFSTSIMTGYYKRDSSDAFDKDGWIRSGDAVYFDDDFCIFIVDRLKEMLKFRGFHITPAKLEGILNSHPEIAAAAVIGIPHEVDGEHPMALVVCQPDATITEDDIVQYVEERVDDRNRLRAGVMFFKKFPYTPSGKIKKNLLKKMILAGKL